MINFGVFLCILGHMTTDQAGSTIARWCLDRRSHTGQWASIYSKLRRFSDVFRLLQLQDRDVSLQRHPCDTKCTYYTLVHVGVSARVISPSQPETLMLCRSFYDPPWLQPWCQRNQRSIFIWILSHWNIEWHLGLKSVVSAAKHEHADNPTMGAEKLFCLRSLERNIITSTYIRQSFECWHFMANGIPRPSAGCNFSLFQFRLIIPPEAEKSARGQNYAWCHFGQIHPQDISEMKSLKKKRYGKFRPIHT